MYDIIWVTLTVSRSAGAVADLRAGAPLVTRVSVYTQTTIFVTKLSVRAESTHMYICYRRYTL